MKLVFSETKLLFPHIHPDDKPETADYDQQHDRYIDQRMVHRRDKGHIFPLIAHQVESRITESGDRMKDTVIDPSVPSQPRHKIKRHHKSARPLKKERAEQRLPDQPHNTADLQAVDGLLQQVS